MLHFSEKFPGYEKANLPLSQLKHTLHNFKKPLHNYQEAFVSLP
jgi:hypothetical protein